MLSCNAYVCLGVAFHLSKLFSIAIKTFLVLTSFFACIF
jgi:hypothetical protein